MKTMREATAAAVDQEALRQIDAWLDEGRYQPVLARLEQLEELARTGSVEAGLRVVRALRGLGGERASEALALRLGRRHRDHTEAVIGMLRTVLGNKGAFAYWRLSQRIAMPSPRSRGERAQALSLRGLWLGGLRDFEAALQAHGQALALADRDPWLWIEQSHTLAAADRYGEALAAAERALEVQPGYRPAVHQRAHLLVLTGRRDEAMALLADALARTGAAPYALQLHMLQHEAGDYEAELATLALAERAMARAEKAVLARLAARRTDALMALGRWAEARGEALRVPGQGFYASLAERLEPVPVAAERVLLPVSFVRQHWATCAPATLASLCAYWNWPAEHLEIAQEICYDGTPAVSERLWIERQGLIAREFRLDWRSARALLDAGVPCGLVTQYAGGAHLQAVIGYDALRGTLLIRDPSQPVHGEFEAKALFEAQRSSGPRALLLLPPAEARRLEGIELPEVDTWDRLHRVLAALERHDRDAARAELQRMREHDAGQWLLARAERTLALYDGDERAILAGTEALLAQFPDEVYLQLSKAASLGVLVGQQAAETWLESLVDRPFAEPLVLERLAGRLADDRRRLPRAFALLRSGLRRAPQQARLWAQWANLRWQERRSDAALPPYRWASTLQPTDEDAAVAYARACRIQGQVEQGIGYLRQRVEQWGDRSGEPALTLADQLSLLERQREADAMLDAAVARRPDDADLKLRIAEKALRLHRLDRARRLIDGATGPVRRGALLRVRGLLAEAEGDFERALADARAAVELEPLNTAHHRMVARLLSRREGRAAAVAWLRAQADRHTAHYPLQMLFYEWLPDVAGEINAQLARIEASHPDDPWLRRELASQASRQQRHADAVALGQRALAAAPDRADSHGTLAFALLRRDGYSAALPHLRRAVELDVDYDYGLSTLIAAAPDLQQTRAAVDCVLAELARQVTIGDALLNLQAQAVRLLPADELEALLRRARDARPELWQGWVALGRQLIEMDRGDAARAVLAEAALRFDALPRLDVEMAEALRLLGLRDEAIAATARALALSPGWSRAVRLQVDLLHERGVDANASAEPVVRRAVELCPEDDDLAGLLAWQLERQGDRDAGFAEARRSLLLNPRPGWVWAIAKRCCTVAERIDRFDALIDEVRQSSPGDAWTWVMLAGQQRDDRLALEAAEQALRLEPKLEAAWLARFERLARLGRHAEIEQALGQLPWPDAAPLAVRAWGARCAWQREQHGSAIGQLRALLAEAPHDEDLWTELADWLDARDDHAGYLEAARHLQRLAPNLARPHGYVGHALAKSGAWAEAVPPLRRALEIEPSYAFAAHWLAESAEKANLPDDADWALETVWPHRPGVRVAARGVRVACAARRRERALHWLDRLGRCDEYELDQCGQAAEAMVHAGWRDDLLQQQLAQIERGDGPPGLPLAWLKDAERRHGWFSTAYRMRGLLRSAQGLCLLRAALRWSADAGHLRTFDWLLQRWGDALRADDATWGDAGYSLLRQDRPRAVRRWLGDWRSRPQAPLWALANLCVAHALLRDWSALAELHERAAPRDPYNEDMRFWGLALHALNGRLDALEHELARVHEWEADAWMNVPLDALRSYLEVARQRAAGASVGAFLALESRLTDTTARSLYRALGWRLRLRHTPWTRLWVWAI